jgi:two-component system chemotaxis response regulator CheY
MFPLRRLRPKSCQKNVPCAKIFAAQVLPSGRGVTLKVIKILDPAARVVMVSSIGQQEIIMEAIRVGAKDFLIKPFRNSQVVKTFSRIFNSYR